MTNAAVRQKLYEYIRIADDKKVKAIFTIVENEINEYNWKDDESFIAELDSRSNDYKIGKVKGVPLEVAKAQILASRKNSK